MEYCDGGDLKEFIVKNKETKILLKENIIWTIFLKILIGLSELHKNKIISLKEEEDDKDKDIDKIEGTICYDGTIATGDEKCPIEAFFLKHEVFPQITQTYTGILFPTDNTDGHRFLFTNTNQSNRTNLFCALTGRNH